MRCPYCEKVIEKGQKRVEVSMPHRAQFTAHKACGERLVEAYASGRVKLKDLDEAEKPE